ncbi:MAG: hypothetical protein ABI282_10320 [Candidatus Baltobacteraceae bacterium]
MSMLAAGLVVATVAAFAGGVSSPPNVVRSGLTASTPAPAPVPQIT